MMGMYFTELYPFTHDVSLVTQVSFQISAKFHDIDWDD